MFGMRLSKGLYYLLAATLFVNILSLALPFLTLQVYDRILPNPESGTLPVLIGGVCAAVTLEILLRLARCWMIGWNGTCYEHKKTCDAIGRMLSSDMTVSSGVGTGEHLNRLSAISRLKDFKNGQSAVVLFELIFVPIFLALVAFVSGFLAIIPVAILAMFIVTSVIQGRKLKSSLIQRDHADDSRYDFLIETLEGMHTLKSFALEERFTRRYESFERESSRANLDVTEYSARIYNTANTFSSFMIAGIITAGAYMVVHGMMTSGALVAAILLSGRVMLPVQRALGLWTRYQDYQIANSKVSQIFALPQTERRVLENIPAKRGSLEIHDLGFNATGVDVAGQGSWIFRNVNLSLGMGESIRISGLHGAGKTVLMKMIAGLYRPTEGEILVDGVNALDYPEELRMEHVGLIGTQGVIFRGTIRDNITRFGIVNDKDAQEVCRLLGIDQEVAKLAKGFDTFLDGTETDAIPPGLRQRISIARALAAKPRIILFDNADRNLDREGYRKVYNLLGRLRERVALVLVTDDRNLGRLADRHFTLRADGLHPIREFHDNIMYGSLHA